MFSDCVDTKNSNEVSKVRVKIEKMAVREYF